MNQAVKNKILGFYTAHKSGVDGLANYLSVPPLWLVSVFYNESGLNPEIENSIHAVGLNQMMPATLAGLGIGKEAFRTGGVEFQLEVMKRFFAPIKGRIKRAGDLYLYNFYPEAVIKNYPMDYAIGEDENFATRHGVSLNKIYDQNTSLDFNKDKKITRQDISDLIESKYDELVSGDFFFRDLWIDIKTNWIAWLIIVVVVVVVIVYLTKK